MEPLTIEQYRALILEDILKIGEDIEDESVKESSSDYFHYFYQS